MEDSSGVPGSVCTALGLSSTKLRVLQDLVRQHVQTDFKQHVPFSKQTQKVIDEIIARVPEIRLEEQKKALKQLLRLESIAFNRDATPNQAAPASYRHDEDTDSPLSDCESD
ncbi:hypothetical protein H1R20_g821, partial [Candolleomyces eurysporus]